MRTSRRAPGLRRRLAVFALIGAVAVGYAGAHYARLTDRVFSTSYGVRIELAQAGGIFPGAEVTYRGVPVGRVASVVPTTDGIAAEVRIEKRWKVPAAARAEVHNRSAVGEQYVDLIPTDDSAPYLHDGSVIARSRTTTPLPEQELLASLDRFVGSVNTDDLGTVVTELGTALAGHGEDLGRLLDGSSTFVAAARKNLPATVALLRTSAVVLRTQDQQASSIRSFSRSLAELTGTVRRKDPQLRRVIDDGTGLTRELTALVDQIAPSGTSLVDNLARLAPIGSRHVDALGQLLVAFPPAVAVAPTGARGGKAQFTLQLTGNPEACQSGYVPPREWRSTQILRDLLPDYSVQCRERGRVPRGSQNAP